VWEDTTNLEEDKSIHELAFLMPTSAIKERCLLREDSSVILSATLPNKMFKATFIAIAALAIVPQAFAVCDGGQIAIGDSNLGSAGAVRSHVLE
jgi:hypothetical protein